MTDVTTNALKGLIKTLGDVVVPAIPADDPLAAQELKMVIRYLAFLRERVDHLHARARFELARQTELVTACHSALGLSEASQADALATLRDRAAGLLASPEATVSALRGLTQEMATAISHLLHSVSDPARLTTIERAVVASAATTTAFDRSWYAPMKLERFPDQVKPLTSFIPL